MINHVGLGVSDLEASKAFYQALEPLGLPAPDGARPGGLRRDGKPDPLIHENRPLSGPTHVAVAVLHRPPCAFHAAALAAGGVDNGPPGPRPQYHQSYYDPEIGTTSKPFATRRPSPTPAGNEPQGAGDRRRGGSALDSGIAFLRVLAPSAR